MLNTIYSCPKATIARVHGICMSVGMGLVAACDITIASAQATFALPETRLGLVPAVIAPYVLRAIGPRQATRWFLTGETFSAAEAWRIGFVHDLCEADSLDLRISALVDTFMLTAPDAVLATKRLVHEVQLRALDEEMAPPPSRTGGADGVDEIDAGGIARDAREKEPGGPAGANEGEGLAANLATPATPPAKLAAVASSASLSVEWAAGGNLPSGLAPV